MHLTCVHVCAIPCVCGVCLTKIIRLCVLKATTVECPSIPSIDPWSIPNPPSIDISVESWPNFSLIYMSWLTLRRLSTDCWSLLIESRPSIDWDINQDYTNQISTVDDPLVHIIQIILGKQLKHVWGTGIYSPCNQSCCSVLCAFNNLQKNSEKYQQIYGIGLIHFYIILLAGLGSQPLGIWW